VYAWELERKLAQRNMITDRSRQEVNNESHSIIMGISFAKNEVKIDKTRRERK